MQEKQRSVLTYANATVLQRKPMSTSRGPLHRAQLCQLCDRSCLVSCAVCHLFIGTVARMRIPHMHSHTAHYIHAMQAHCAQTILCSVIFQEIEISFFYRGATNKYLYEYGQQKQDKNC